MSRKEIVSFLRKAKKNVTNSAFTGESLSHEIFENKNSRMLIS